MHFMSRQALIFTQGLLLSLTHCTQTRPTPDSLLLLQTLGTHPAVGRASQGAGAGAPVGSQTRSVKALSGAHGHGAPGGAAFASATLSSTHLRAASRGRLLRVL